MTTAQGNRNDPLDRFRDGAVAKRTGHSLPLTATAIDVRVRGAIATVTTARTFTNPEIESIEATITFPVPVNATVFGLSAEIDGRQLVAKARPRSQARDTYEGAIDRGKSAVLHEEVLRGVHMLLVGHIPPGKNIVVTDRWVVPLAASLSDGARLRIPVTVGDVYGRSPLADSDDLIHDDVVHRATLTATCADGPITIGGISLEGVVEIALDRPIDLASPRWAPGALQGRAADGRGVSLLIECDPVVVDAIETAIVVDGSGSMREAWSGVGGLSKGEAVLAGLRSAAGAFREKDRVGLYEFSDRSHLIGKLSGTSLPALLDRFTASNRGTEIGGALMAVAEHGYRNVLIITDGKSHALDVQALAATGCRFTAVLVGEDSLEAHIGHLCAATGGGLFIASGCGADDAIRQAVRALRVPLDSTVAVVGGAPVKVVVRRGGMRITAEWTAASPVDGADDDVDAHAVGVLAAALAIPFLPADEATAVAIAHGLVGHLTSLVLIDDAGELQEGLPASRKVPLMTPAGQKRRMSLFGLVTGMGGHGADAGDIAYQRRPSTDQGKVLGSGRNVVVTANAMAMDSPAPAASGMLEEDILDGPAFLRRSATAIVPDAGSIDFSRNPENLRRGDFDDLSPTVRSFLEQMPASAEVATLAAYLGAPPSVIVLALLAWRDRGQDRHAARFARAVLGTINAERLAALCREVGIMIDDTDPITGAPAKPADTTGP